MVHACDTPGRSQSLSQKDTSTCSQICCCCKFLLYSVQQTKDGGLKKVLQGPEAIEKGIFFLLSEKKKIIVGAFYPRVISY